jgi:hypothetical protein
LGVAVAVVTWPLLVAACGSGNTSSPAFSPEAVHPPGASSSAGGTTSSTALSCSLVPASAVQAVLGLTVNDPTSRVHQPVIDCNYPDALSPTRVMVRIETGVDTGAFAGHKAAYAAQGNTVIDVSGLGDAAFSSSHGQLHPSGTLSATNPGVYATVSVLQGGVELTITSPSPVDRLEALARQVLGSL